MLLDDPTCFTAFASIAEAFAAGEVPLEIVRAISLGRMSALKKPNGRVRGIVAGSTFRRVVARALSLQYSSAIDTATSPFQFALSTRAGTNALGLLLRGITDNDPEAVVISLDGIGAFDHLRRAAILQKLLDTPALHGLIPFVRQFYGSTSVSLWTDANGTTHDIVQGEGGEQGDPLMPALFALGLHDALVKAQNKLSNGDRLFAFLDDLYLVTTKARARKSFDIVTQEVQNHAGIQTNLGKLHAWCRGGGEGPADLAGLGPEIWMSNHPSSKNGLIILGAPLGHPDFVAEHATSRMAEENRLLQKLPDLPDLQTAWALLFYSAVPRANHLLRVLPPSLSHQYAADHDTSIWHTLCAILGAHDREHDGIAKSAAALPTRMGGLGLRNANRTAPAAYWAAWADALPVMASKAPTFATAFTHLLAEAIDIPPCFQEAADSLSLLQGEGFNTCPDWHSLLSGARPPLQLQAELGEFPHGWQFHACSVRETYFKEHVLMPTLLEPHRAMLRSQSGPSAGKWLSALPVCPETTLTTPRMQCALRRRLRWPLPLPDHHCKANSCKHQLDVYGDHLASCPRIGLLKRKGTPLECAWARVFSEKQAALLETKLF